jgi:hypothetical protein
VTAQSEKSIICKKSRLTALHAGIVLTPPLGAAHEKNYQHHLEQACLALHGQDKPVNVRIRPEPFNPMDPSAIAIDVDYGTGWTHVMLVILLLNYASICTH